jgi:phosphopantetheine--protein transferase-like protein
MEHTAFEHTIGTDIVAVARIARLVDARGDAFVRRWFTPSEIAYCAGKAEPARHLAARFAAKEAVLKAVPVVWEGPLPWRSVEIVSDGRSAPRVHLSGAVAAAARRSGVTTIALSMSHCDEYATATALAVARTAAPSIREGSGSPPGPVASP